MFAKSQVLLQYAVSDEISIKQHFKQIVRIIVIEDDSLSESSRVIAQIIDWIFPHFYELYYIGSQFSEMVDILKYNLQLIFPTFTALLCSLLLFVLPMFFRNLRFALGFFFFLDRMQTFLDFQLFQSHYKFSQIMQTRLSRFDSLFYNVVGVFFLCHVFDLW